jgi:hypothetical protein
MELRKRKTRSNDIDFISKNRIEPGKANKFKKNSQICVPNALNIEGESNKIEVNLIEQVTKEEDEVELQRYKKEKEEMTLSGKELDDFEMWIRKPFDNNESGMTKKKKVSCPPIVSLDELKSRKERNLAEVKRPNSCDQSPRIRKKSMRRLKDREREIIVQNALQNLPPLMQQHPATTTKALKLEQETLAMKKLLEECRR